MSGGQIGTVVGGAIGFYFGGPAGAQLGMAIGGTIGNAVDPEVIKAPSIGDAQKQTAQAGVPRPVVYGHPAPFAGNIIDGEAKARKIIVEEGGKGGGPIVESERFLMTYAIRICEGPIAGVVRIWRNGEVVYDRRNEGDFPAFAGGDLSARLAYIAAVRAKSASFQNKVRIYLGGEDQLPDAALEAIHGVDNTPYYRGTAYIVVEDDDVTDTRGAAAQYQFEVLAVGSDSSDAVEVLPTVAYDYNNGGNGSGFYVHDTFLGFTRLSVPVAKIEVAPYLPYDANHGGPSRYVLKLGGRILYDTGWRGNPVHQAELDAQLISEGRGDLAGAISIPPPFVSSIFSMDSSGEALTSTVYFSGVGGPADNYGIDLNLYLMDAADIPAEWSTTPELPGAIIGGDGLLYYPDFITPSEFATITPGSVWLDSVVEDIALRCGVPAGKLDASALSGHSIPGLLVANQTTGADCLRPTQQMFFYDLPEVDGRIVAVNRGGAIAVTITDDDLLETGDDDEAIRPQQIEYPAKVSVFTQDPAAEYAAIPQTSIRTSPNIKATSEFSVQSPIPFSADEAKRRADIIHKVLFSQSEGRRDFALPEEFSRLVPSDCFAYNGKRWLIEQKDATEGENRFKCVYDRASAYTSAAVGVSPTPPALPSSGLRGPTTFIAMNLPALRAQDSVAGMYVAACGTFADWPGCDLYLSVDVGITEQRVLSMTSAATMGTITGAITTSTTLIPVSVRGQLSSVSAEQIAAGANAFAVISSGVAEVGQFQTADLTAAGAFNDYDLTDITRPQLGTIAASHAAGDPFVMLNAAVYFLPIDSIHIGKTLIFRAVTKGTVPANNATFSAVFAAPADIIIDGGGA